jgi:DnaA family protein
MKFASRTSREHFAYLRGRRRQVACWRRPRWLARPIRAAARALYSPFSIESEFVYSPEVDLYLLDDCEKLSPLAQIDAFALFNEIRANNAFMVCSGNVAPAVLPVREDLRTRMGWGLIYQIHGLTDDEKSPPWPPPPPPAA